MSKPILSELEYNASDVASAILSKADLSVTNQDFAVSNVISKFTIDSAWGWNTDNNHSYSFNGFVFFQFYVYKTSTPSHQESVMQINDSDYYPNAVYNYNSMGYQGDSSQFVQFRTDGDVQINDPNNQSSANFYMTFGGMYRF